MRLHDMLFQNKGRKNIRQIMKQEELDEETRKTAKEEELRKKRILERQALVRKRKTYGEWFNGYL